MAGVTVVRELTRADRTRIDAFLSHLSRHAHRGGPGTECERLADHLLLDFRHGPRPGFVAAIATDGERMVGYAQASASAGGHVVDSVADPSAGARLDHDMLVPLLAALPDDRRVTWWAHDDDAELAARLGLQPARRLLQMWLPLSVATLDRLAAVPPLATRPFRPGRDEQEWLAVNNAAFAWHDEQGEWDLELLVQRMREPWFDADGFLIHEDAGRMTGFCWTKVHPARAGSVADDGTEPPGSPRGGAPERSVGEIYVIAVHPDHRRSGLGRALTVAGLRHLAAAGAAACMLFVDAGNSRAVELYRALGFVTVHAEQAFVRPGTTTATAAAAALEGSSP